MSLSKQEQAEDKNTPAPILKTLASDEDWMVREAVANHGHILAKTLDDLSNDENELVRLAVSLNKHTNSKTLTTMCSDESDSVRLNISKHPEVTLRVLTVLSLGNMNKDLAQSIIKNPKTQEKVIVKLTALLEEL